MDVARSKSGYIKSRGAKAFRVFGSRHLNTGKSLLGAVLISSYGPPPGYDMTHIPSQSLRRASSSMAFSHIVVCSEVSSLDDEEEAVSNI